MNQLKYNGYRADLENHARLAAGSAAFDRAFSRICGATPATLPPEEIDHRGWLQIENQAAEGSCSGHMTSSILEVCNYIQTGGGIVQLSRMFAYLNGQREAGLLGADQGCTIQGVIEAARKRGICLESTFPYSGRYSTEVPDAAWTEAAPHTCGSYSPMQSERDVFAFQALGIGGNALGIPWTERLAASRGIVELADVQEYRGNGLLGMHAVPLLGYSRRKSNDGRNYYWLPNSHSRQWGNNGWAEVSPLAVDYWLSINCVVLGVSDMKVYGPRKIKSFKGMFSA